LPKNEKARNVEREEEERERDRCGQGRKMNAGMKQKKL
jgi:hypothetical protein